jgi:hypothetical protein
VRVPFSSCSILMAAAVEREYVLCWLPFPRQLLKKFGSSSSAGIRPLPGQLWANAQATIVYVAASAETLYDLPIVSVRAHGVYLSSSTAAMLPVLCWRPGC